MDPIQPHWVGIISVISGIVGSFIPKISEWVSGRKKDQQSDVAFVVQNLKELTTSQSDKLTKMETRLLDMQQKLIDMQTAHVQTFVENVTMKKQVDDQAKKIADLTSENQTLRLEVDDLKRRISK